MSSLAMYTTAEIQAERARRLSTFNATEDDDDVLPLPTVNYAKWAAEDRQREQQKQAACGCRTTNKELTGEQALYAARPDLYMED